MFDALIVLLALVAGYVVGYKVKPHAPAYTPDISGTQLRSVAPSIARHLIKENKDNKESIKVISPYKRRSTTLLMDDE